MSRVLHLILTAMTSPRPHCAQQAMKGPKETNFQKYIFLFLSSLLIPNHLDDISRCIIYDSNATYVTEFPETLMIGKILHQILTSLIFTSSCLFSAASFIGVFPYLSVVILAPCLSNHRTWDSKLLHYYMPVL